MTRLRAWIAGGAAVLLAAAPARAHGRCAPVEIAALDVKELSGDEEGFDRSWVRLVLACVER